MIEVLEICLNLTVSIIVGSSILQKMARGLDGNFLCQKLSNLSFMKVEGLQEIVENVSIEKAGA